jgi:hypothetical protein
VLSEADLHQLESSLLPALERHHLRLLAHSLRCLQQAAGSHQASLPDQGSLQAWAERQPNLAVDPSFIPVLVEQLAKAAAQLQAIGAGCGKEPLALEISDLVAWGQAQAQARIAALNQAAAPPHS